MSSSSSPSSTNGAHAENRFSLPQMELDVLDFWQQHQIFKQSLEETRQKPPFLFYDGPPFATGLPHHGHLLASTVKDIIPRYFTMRGHHVSRRFGWDCHGLPIEHEIDKQLGMSTQQAVEKLGVHGYNNACRGIVQRYVSQWRQTINRLGRWVDFDDDYKTMDTPFMESVWWVFKQLWEKDLIYRGTKVVPFSTALGTVLSNFEASSNYQSVQDPAVTVLFKHASEEVYFAAWTTTPWTLPSNLGLAVHPELHYVRVRDEQKGVEFILAKSCLEAYQQRHQLTVVTELMGAELVGMEYQPLFGYFADRAQQGAFKVVAADFIAVSEGTGIVHMAPAFGEDDQKALADAGMNAMVCPIDDAGCFTSEVPDFVGQYVKDADKAIIKVLKQRQQLYEQQTIVHNYPFCPRSDTPLLYRAIPSWYVKVEAIKERMQSVNQRVHWVPDHIASGRFGQWLAGARDWAISRNRVWGTPLPVWHNEESGRYLCVGSIAELAKYTGETVSDLHRDSIDHLTFSLPNENGTYRRITEVLDCWFESGSMPYAQLHYPFENAEQFEQSFPAAFIAEGLDQTRGWFYTLMVLAVALFDQPAFQNVIVTGIVMAEDGKKMSKRLQNYTAPDVLMDEYGADALRLYLINSGLVKGEEQRFSDAGVQEMVRRTLLPWYNAFKFFMTYATIDEWSWAEHQQAPAHHLDGWLLSRCQSLCALIEQHMQQYHLYQVVPALLSFIDELTNVYIRFNRQRFWGEGMTPDKAAAFTTLYTVLLKLTQMMAPFTPFLSEHIYQQLKSLSPDLPLSVHLCAYPEVDKALIQNPLEAAVDRLQQIVLLGRQQRNTEKIKVKIPLQRLTIVHQDQSLLDEIAKLEDVLRQELNVKEVVYDCNEAQYIRLYAKPCSPRLGKRFGQDFPRYRQAIEAMSVAEIRAFEESGRCVCLGEELVAEDVLIFREAKEGSGALSNRLISIVLDTQLTDALRHEGMARELVSAVQKARKDAGFAVQDRIVLTVSEVAAWQPVLAMHQHSIATEVLALQVHQEATLEGGHVLTVEGASIHFTVTKHQEPTT